MHNVKAKLVQLLSEWDTKETLTGKTVVEMFLIQTNNVISSGKANGAHLFNIQMPNWVGSF